MPRASSRKDQESKPDTASKASLRKAFREELGVLCKNVGTTVSENAKFYPNQIRIEFAPHFPMWIRIDVDEPSETAVLAGVVRTFGFSGDRSDYHELISLLWAAHLRNRLFASARLVDIPHPHCPGELYGRYLFFDQQPQLTFIQLGKPNFQLIEQLLVESCFAAQFFSMLYRMSDGDPGRESVSEGERWANTIERAMRWKSDDLKSLSNQRQHPDWCYYYRDDHFLTAFALKVNLLVPLVESNIGAHSVVLNVGKQYLIQTGEIKNTIDESAIRKLYRLLSAYGVRVNGVLKSLFLKDQGRVLFLPVDSHLICITDRGIAAIATNGDRETFVRAEALLRERHQKEAEFLNSSVRFRWARRVDSDRFEELALELLNREPGVKWVRRMGAGRASDGGRDLIVEWQQTPAKWETASESQAVVCRQVIVQCKAYTGSINRSSVGDVPGTVDVHDANGYLLIAYPRVTPTLVDYLRKVPAKRRIWADWWTQPEIEERLRRNMDIVRRYTDLLIPISEQG